MIECFFCECWEGEARGGPLVMGPGLALLSKAAKHRKGTVFQAEGPAWAQALREG